MSAHGHRGAPVPAAPGPVPPAEPLTRWQKFRLIVKVVELRLRFVALMAATGLVFANWETLWNEYDKRTRPPGEPVVAAAGVEYYCPMHPSVVQDQPGHCPICGMPLSKRKKGQKETLPEGVTARVQLAPFRIAQAGIRTAEVGYAPLSETVTTVGSVDYDERRRAVIASKLKGMARVETLHVNFTGTAVRKGEPLAELYSPELYQAVQELLLAARSARERPRPQTALGRSVLGEGGDLLRAATEKLRLWGIAQAQIDEILRTGKADVTVPIPAPISGDVIKKDVVEGQYVAEGQAMFAVADLSRVWVRAQVYEDQLALVRVGQPVEATVEAFPGEVFPGTVAFIQPQLDPATRTVDVRYDLENPGHRLRPGMYATVTLKSPLADSPAFRTRAADRHEHGTTRLVGLTAAQQGRCPVTRAKLGSMGDPIAVEVQQRRVWVCCPGCSPKLKAEPAKYLARLETPPAEGVLSVPETAVIDTGDRKVVYIETEPGVFEGRQVVLGPRIGDRFPVLDGLEPGAHVAAAGAFLIDAESRLNAGSGPATDATTTPTAPTRSAAGQGPIHRH
jgi:Cu(I)/Ag(I) efflux system membrane fusion protein